MIEQTCAPMARAWSTLWAKKCPRTAQTAGGMEHDLVRRSRPMSERNPRWVPPYSPDREYDPEVRVLAFRDVPEADWRTQPKTLDPAAWVEGIGREQKRVQQLERMPYEKEYLHTAEWKRLRVLVIGRAGGQCERCHRRAGEWNVHHLTYERRGHELLEDLILLCRRCHRAEHGLPPE